MIIVADTSISGSETGLKAVQICLSSFFLCITAFGSSELNSDRIPRNLLRGASIYLFPNIFLREGN
ncbi:MAG TPA: hypothetical protein DHW42_03290 [Candidatus Marinimicrobia bacterium]|nr:hypothetical protein [Candidatus Neomarinimicrobiota bacterium]